MCTIFNGLLNFNFYLNLFSDRLDVLGCLNHKWLKEDTPILPSPPQSQQILTVQTSNVTITTSATEESVDVIKSCTLKMTNDENDHEHISGSKRNGDDENKENSSTRQLTIVNEQPCVTETTATSTITFLATTGNAAKLVLEKSSSISLFPAIAPTTPKVCRKMIYEDEADLKEIVKKYQTSCCDGESDCLICHMTAKAPSLGLDKGITSC